MGDTFLSPVVDKGSGCFRLSVPRNSESEECTWRKVLEQTCALSGVSVLQPLMSTDVWVSEAGSRRHRSAPVPRPLGRAGVRALAYLSILGVC